MKETLDFRCPNCETNYRVAAVEAPQKQDKLVTCLGCGAPLLSRRGKFVLKYFRISGSSRRGRGPRLV
jgi:predicted Zn finger-like uncharacterized protein